MKELVAKRAKGHFEGVRISANDLASMATKLCENLELVARAVGEGHIPSMSEIYPLMQGLRLEMSVCERRLARWAEARALVGEVGRLEEERERAHRGDAENAEQKGGGG